jgi:hypothetical protein
LTTRNGTAMTVHDSVSDDQRSAESSPETRSSVRKRSNKSTTVGGAALAILIAVYAIVQPVLNDRFGWQLPGVQQFAQNDGAAVAEKDEKRPEKKEAVRTEDTPAPDVKEQAATESKPKPGSGPLANVRTKTSSQPQKTAPAESVANDSLLYGILADQGNDRFLSPAGLLYVPGSQEGHRLKHVERHTIDDPGRPGSHGVFDGGMATALVTIDKAYRKAKTGSQTSTHEEGGRTIYTVDMGARVGYVGGSDGKRRKNPMARRVRLVLERNRVITAYPM